MYRAQTCQAIAILLHTTVPTLPRLYLGVFSIAKQVAAAKPTGSALLNYCAVTDCAKNEVH